ncbi:alpha/beta hydrolase [Actinoplanes italicus]|uniref:Alpha-beta hydrolase superfamily lysophospholipase n=1 Tax=Actinoplanes italicus TaxID=113567 RepID=A0A2T0K3R4_9ACTN|nr:alpha/beta fold hydrolase [Actinoplanes italicus]PRX17510.1 alpha-beta hydrolase superfamily lysophospholipase [Actinoplanes italicus]GIE34803.1 alpha/beta hydrolase [Actinoplanes italicus]
MPTFEATDGVEIYWEQWDGDSDLPPVLLHHGFIANGLTNWVLPGIVGALTATGRRVIAVDARGHGRSGKPHDPSFYGETRMAKDVATLLDRLGIERVDVAGYSMGAIVSLVLATSDPRLRRLVIGGVGSAVVELGGVDTRIIPAEAFREAFHTDDPSTITHPAAAGFRAFVDAVGGDRAALAAQAAAIHATPLPLDTIAVPTLLITGRDDVLATRPELLAKALPNARLAVIDGDHLGAVREPAFTEELVTFLNAR